MANTIDLAGKHAVAAFCASADCSFTTGSAIDISGGRATC